MRGIRNLAAAALLALGLQGCASNVMDYSEMPRERGQATVENDGHKPLQCVPYAREHSAIKIYGDAYTWWDQAAGKYPRGPLPEPGTVIATFGGSNLATSTGLPLCMPRLVLAAASAFSTLPSASSCRITSGRYSELRNCDAAYIVPRALWPLLTCQPMSFSPPGEAA